MLEAPHRFECGRRREVAVHEAQAVLADRFHRTLRPDDQRSGAGGEHPADAADAEHGDGHAGHVDRPPQNVVVRLKSDTSLGASSRPVSDFSRTPPSRTALT